MNLNSEYWTERYLQYRSGWDVGEATKPIKQYLDQIRDRQIEILVPGAGNAYEAIYAFEIGFANTHLLDFSPVPIEQLRARHPAFPASQIHLADFFDHQGSYDLILEQTFFCALEPVLRPNYVEKASQLLKPGGKLAGVLFDRDFGEAGPPFGGSQAEYRLIFQKHFEIIKLEECYNSIPPRAGSEVFCIFGKK